MKHLLLFIMLVGVLPSFGQTSNTSPNEWDSLFHRNKTELRQFENIVQKYLCDIDTIKLKSTITITYFSESKTKLKRIQINLDSESCPRGIFTQYYNTLGLLSYAFGYKKCCPEEEQYDDKCFERVTEYERFEYDKMDRPVVHVYHINSRMTYKEIYSYDKDGTKRINRIKISEPKFWE